MAVSTDALKNKLAKRPAGGTDKAAPRGNTVAALIERLKPQIARALPKHISPERFARIVLTQIRTNPKLLECDQQSLLAAVMLSAQLGLEPGPLGHSWIIPYGKEATFIIGYKGYLELIWRSGRVQSLSVHEVCENDEFEFEYGLNETLRHKPAIKDRGKVIGYYLVARYKDGGHFIYWMSIDDIEKIRQRSKAKDSGPWQTDYDAMARKTVVRQAARWMPLSIEVQRAMAFDESSPTQIDEDMLSQQPRFAEEDESIDIVGTVHEVEPDEQEPPDGQQSVLDAAS